MTDPVATPVHPGGVRPPLAAPDRERSFAVCRAVTARANSSFPLAFRLLPPAKRRAMDALYAFMRITDDLADEPGPVASKRDHLAAWRVGLADALEGRFTHPVLPALADTVHRYGVPVRYLNDVIDGVEADLEPVRYAAFADLYPYCYRVASAVGLACVRVWGVRPGVTFEQTLVPAEAAGIAFQLTNILRDLGEDAANGRVYLPLEELARFGCSPGTWDARSEAFREMMRFQAARAWEYYHRAEPLAALLTTEGRAIFRVMCGTYRGLLTEIERRGFDVLSGRVRVPKWRKAAILFGGWAAKWV
ncbi:phytoene/squalene synthase family protein [Gemmata sp.]|uniref:phytoene/squalene synthase family protein n=1 Tax=Gemmata sp. TaxID=1914242 RepID=UPI003F6EB72C